MWGLLPNKEVHACFESSSWVTFGSEIVCLPNSETRREYRSLEKCDSWVASAGQVHFWRYNLGCSGEQPPVRPLGGLYRIEQQQVKD